METHSPDFMTFALRLAVTFFFVAANGFFVAAEFALVKVQVNQLRERSKRSKRARVAYHIRSHLDMYLSACQLGITLSSLILGWRSSKMPSRRSWARLRTSSTIRWRWF